MIPLPPARRLRGGMPLLTRARRRPDRAASVSPARSAAFARGFSAMRHANYRRYWFGQIGSLVGAWMQSVALPWLVLELGGSPLQLGLLSPEKQSLTSANDVTGGAAWETGLATLTVP